MAPLEISDVKADGMIAGWLIAEYDRPNKTFHAEINATIDAFTYSAIGTFSFRSPYFLNFMFATKIMGKSGFALDAYLKFWRQRDFVLLRAKMVTY